MEIKKNCNIALAQINPIVGNFEYNKAKIIDYCHQAIENKADIVIFPEFSLIGYFPKDLIFHHNFLKKNEECLDNIAKQFVDHDILIIIGSVYKNENNSISNTAFFIHQGEIKHLYHKKHLPNYGVFDEKRYFVAGDQKIVDTIYQFKQIKILPLICNDLWQTANQVIRDEFDLVVVLNASPFETSKLHERVNLAKNFTLNNNFNYLIYLNLYGGQDELIFDGSSFCYDKKQGKFLQLKSFAEDFAVIEFYQNNAHLLTNIQQNSDPAISETGMIYTALVCSLRDYIKKNNFTSVIIGLSGGVDSALTLAIAIDALGTKQVEVIMLPTKITSQVSYDDAYQIIANTDVKHSIFNIEQIRNLVQMQLKQYFDTELTDITEQNIQARIRGLILMAVSNQTKKLLLSTSNKSESAVGYSTLYGDSCGGFAPLKDVYKTQIYQLCLWRNSNYNDLFYGQNKIIIPQSIIDKEPTAELAYGQKDSDTIPPYDILDKILHELIENRKSVAEITGYDKNLVVKISKLLYSSEYKRAQSVMGTKISKESFIADRRMPITNHYDR